MTSIVADFHVHTHLSPCGDAEATAEAMLERARSKGLAAIGFADHITPEPVPGCPFYDGQQRSRLDDLHEELGESGRSGDLDVLVGCEADYTLAGPRCVDRALLTRVDHVIGAASHFHLPAAPRPATESPGDKAALMVRMAREMLVMPGISVWAHPFDCSEMRPLAPLMAVIDRATQAALIHLANANEVAIEINGGPARQDDYREATAGFFRLALALGARFTITADAHHPDDLDRLDLALEWARSLDIPDERFLTADDLRARQARKRSRLSFEEVSCVS